MMRNKFTASAAQVARAAGVAAGVAIVAAPATTQVALAHDSVIGGAPANGETVTEFPGTLELEFSGLPKEGFNTFALSRVADGKPDVLYSGEPELDGRWARLELPADVAATAAEEPGEYRIGFQIISSDGHATKGMTTFAYAPGSMAPAGDAGKTAEYAAQEEKRSNITLILAILGVLVIAGAGLAAFGKTRKSRELDEKTVLDEKITAEERQEGDRQ